MRPTHQALMETFGMRVELRAAVAGGGHSVQVGKSCVTPGSE